MSILTPLPVKESVIEIREFKNRVAIYFTPTEAKNFDNYISHMGINKNYLVDREIEEFVDNKRPVIKADARQLNYEGEKKTVLRTIFISDVIEAILDIKAKEYSISRSSFAAQAAISYIENN